MSLSRTSEERRGGGAGRGETGWADRTGREPGTATEDMAQEKPQTMCEQGREVTDPVLQK